jgi:hypothetical protein
MEISGEVARERPEKSETERLCSGKLQQYFAIWQLEDVGNLGLIIG